MTERSCIQNFGDSVDSKIANFFLRIGNVVAHHPRKTIILCILAAGGITAGGFLVMNTESRGEKLFVPQDTEAQEEADAFESYFPSLSRLEQILVEPKEGTNVLTKEHLVDAMKMHEAIAAGTSETDGVTYDLVSLCTEGGSSCLNQNVTEECSCVMSSIFRQWNYDIETLEADNDVLTTISEFGSIDDLNTILSEAVYDTNGKVVSARAFSMSYFLVDRSYFDKGFEVDPVSEDWEKDVFLETVEAFETDYPSLALNWFTIRSYEDAGAQEIEGDLALVQVSYLAVFIFMGATLGRFRCGLGSRWTMAWAAVALVFVCTFAGTGLSALLGFDYTPLHALLPFVLLGIGVDDAFVIANAFDQERRGKLRSRETNEALLLRSSRALARAGASITVTSLTDLVAFAISATSQLPALSSFSVYASISVFFLWVFAATFFTACMVIDERRQNENRKECCCCKTRPMPIEEAEAELNEDRLGLLPSYFRHIHSRLILSRVGKMVVLLGSAGLLGVSVYWATQLTVEDTQRQFIPEGSSLRNYFDASDELFPDQGIDLYFVFEGQQQIYDTREELSKLNERVASKSTAPPYIAEPTSEEVFRNVMAGFKDYLTTEGTSAIGGLPLGDDNWPMSVENFVSSLESYVSIEAGSRFSNDVSFGDDGSLLAFSVQTEFVRLTKESRGEVIDDAARQIEAMDATRAMVDGWTDLQPCFPFSENFILIEGFKAISAEFVRNILLALGCVALIVLVTVASPFTAFFITVAVMTSIVNILGFMYLFGLVIDSPAVVMLTLAIGLSVDYSAHIGHCFMTKKGDDKDKRVIEALEDVGSAVLNGAISTFLAVAVLLFSSSYVFFVLSRMFLLTVLFGAANGIILLPVLLSIWGPAAFAGDHGLHDKNTDTREDADMDESSEEAHDPELEEVSE